MAEDADDELEAIRERKRAELRARAEGDEGGQGPSPDTSGAVNDPVRFDGGSLVETVTQATGDGTGVALVDFYADWCGPCKMLEPTLERIAAETDAAVVKVDIDANQAVAAEYQVQSVPTMLLFVDGQPTQRLVGVKGEAELTSLIESHS